MAHADLVGEDFGIELRELTAQLIASRRRLADIEQLRTWNSDLRHHVWRAHVKSELVGLDVEERADLEDEVALYVAAVHLLEAAA
jgi:hypothetical protein